jgi:hypothetical protein
LDRAGFLSLGARGGAAVAMGAAGAGLLVDRAGAATGAATASGVLTDLDYGIARLAVGAELLAAEFYTQAIAAKKFAGPALGYLNRALFNEREHLKAVSEILTGGGQTASTADDFEITFPKGSFDSRGSIAKLGLALETAFVGAYLGAVDTFAPADLKTTAARIAASEAQHLSLFAGLAGNHPVGVSFPPALDYASVSDLLDTYLA